MQGNGPALANDLQKFSAFISYNHADHIIAAKLQKRLENYRLPKHIRTLIDREDNRLGQIFRDREDLAASPSLSDAIRNALAQSQALIVICSPDAAASHWVTQEITLFRALHPDRPILAALVNGDPATAFPAALTSDGNEPLAADLRAGGDGEQLGFLKIVAGITHVPLDALIQRDAQRKIRRVTAITLGAITAMLIMAVMTAYALSARNEAKRQRAEAEDLVEYMVTDLHEKLKGVGRLDIMAAVNQRALEHYGDAHNLANLPADSLERRARVLHAMGEGDEKHGDLISALLRWQEAHRTTAALLAQDSNNPDRIFAHAQSEYWLGYAGLKMDQRDKAQTHWLNYKHLADKLYNLAPNQKRSLQEIGFAEGDLCTLALKVPINIALGNAACINALTDMQKIYDSDKNNHKSLENLINRHAYLAKYYELVPQLNLALQHRKLQLSLAQKLHDSDLKNMDWIAILAIAKLANANTMLDFPSRNYNEQIKELVIDAQVMRKQIIDNDPENRWLSDMMHKFDKIKYKLKG